jgi:hypothetical protein
MSMLFEKKYWNSEIEITEQYLLFCMLIFGALSLTDLK